MQSIDVRSVADIEDDWVMGIPGSWESPERADSRSLPECGPPFDQLPNEVTLDSFIEQPDVLSTSPALGRASSGRRQSSTIVFDAVAATKIHPGRTTPVPSPLRNVLDTGIDSVLPSLCSVLAPIGSTNHRGVSGIPSGKDGSGLADEVTSSPDAMGHWRHRANSTTSSVAALVGLNQGDLTELLNNKQAGGAFMLGKMLIVVGLPAMTLVVLASLLLWNAVSTQAVSRQAISDLRRFLSVDDLVTNIQV